MMGCGSLEIEERTDKGGGVCWLPSRATPPYYPKVEFPKPPSTTDTKIVHSTTQKVAAKVMKPQKKSNLMMITNALNNNIIIQKVHVFTRKMG